ncbi:hypothetical protein MJO29_013647 [Puccinia striiformis f. sp. tritici]|nr:hypothetical protein MJO29_013647 [Puccinia striiformis f. sp. tritici]
MKKLPPTTELTTITTTIKHCGSPLTPNLVIHHLKLYANNLASSSSAPKSQIALFSDESRKCKTGTHNPRSTHPESECWKVYPHKNPHLQQNNPENQASRSETTVSSFISSQSFPSSSFILDSGSSAHMTSDLNLFTSLKLKEEGVVKTSSGAESLKIKGSGTLNLSNKFGDFLFPNTLFVPDLVVNLLSVRCLVMDGYHIVFEMNEFLIYKDNLVCMKGRYRGNLLCLEFINHRSHISASEDLHKLLGHVSYHRIRQRLGIPISNPTVCEACAVSKITKGSFHTQHSHASKPFEELHMDLVGPITPTSRGGHRYFLTVVNSCTRFISAIPLKRKNDATESIIQAIDLEAKHFGYYPTVIHSDRGTEFVNSKMIDFCNSHSIRSRQSDAYTPQQNGLAERFNRTILESVRTVFKDSGLRKDLWNEIIKSCSLVLNQIPTHRSKRSPFELFRSRSLPIKYFKPLGIRVSYLILPEVTGSKLSPKGELGKLIGYNEELRSYRILSDNGRIINSNHVQFLDFPSPSPCDEPDFHVMEESLESNDTKSDSGTILPEENSIENDDLSPSEDNFDSAPEEICESSDEDVDVATSLVPETRSLRDRTSKVKPTKYSYLTGDPTSFKMAMKCPKKIEWEQAVDQELENIEGHDVWDDMYCQPASLM